MSQVLSTDLPPYLSRLDEAQRKAALDTNPTSPVPTSKPPIFGGFGCFVGSV